MYKLLKDQKKCKEIFRGNDGTRQKRENAEGSGDIKSQTAPAETAYDHSPTENLKALLNIRPLFS